ncbi:hypothetical protein CA51_19440 [Rosistilla oblonga]|uniref:Uncharacterized protein n=2 Tax=Rosistilla oblonga TaxID=2527990 RepID=A0A518ISJ9_9BACT|nr:hypothetical protein CA51_19440 [Rosistilla oblonga]QDV56059.1 hypothetical protein Mal33_20380 [Rosistilla oblonga]
MTEYRFRVVINHRVVNEHQMLELADRLAAAGCDDGHLGGHSDGIEVVFDREAASRDEAMRSAIEQIEGCGLVVKRIELDREVLAA